MTHNDTALRPTIRAKAAEIAARLGHDAAALADDDPLLAGGLIDSAGMMELILWLETAFELEIDIDELDLENFASVAAIARFVAGAAAPVSA